MRRAAEARSLDSSRHFLRSLSLMPPHARCLCPIPPDAPGLLSQGQQQRAVPPKVMVLGRRFILREKIPEFQ